MEIGLRPTAPPTACADIRPPRAAAMRAAIPPYVVVVTADIVYVGHSSMEISVNVIVEDLDEGSDPQLGLSAYFTMVALDRNARPKAVPPLELKTEEARAAFEEGKRRYEAHKARKRGVTIPTGGCVCDAIAQQAKASREQREAEKQ